MPIAFSMKIRKFSRVTQFLSLSKVSLLKFSENAQKVFSLMTIMIYKEIFKSDTFENYKSFVPVEVQSLCQKKLQFCWGQSHLLVQAAISTTM